MKKIFNILFATAVVTFATTNITFAQAKKIAVLNTEKIFVLMPEKPAADSAVYKYQVELSKELEEKQKVLEAKYSEFQAKEKEMSETMKNLKMKEFQEDQARLQDFYNTIENELMEKQNKLYKPISDKIINAAKEVAKEKGYGQIMDASSFIYFDEADLIDELVKAKLKLK